MIAFVIGALLAVTTAGAPAAAAGIVQTGGSVAQGGVTELQPGTTQHTGLAWEPRFAGPGLDAGSSVGGTGGAQALAVWDDGDGPALYAGGYMMTAGGHQVNRIARWDGAEWSPLTGPDGTGIAMVGSGNPSIKAMTVYGGDLIVAGFFDRAGGVSVNNIARWDGTQWYPLGEGVTGSVGINALAVHDGSLIAGGHFRTAGGVDASRVARWDGGSWAPLGAGTGGTVYALASYGGALYAGGSFTEAGGVDASRIARWDGPAGSGAWSPVAAGMDSSVYALAVHDGKLLAGGRFTEAGGAPAGKIASWDGGSWSALGAGFTGVGNVRVLTLTTFDGQLVAGGAFREADGVTVNYIATWDGSGWSALSGPAGTGTDNGVSDVIAYGGELIAASAAFRTAGGVTVNHIARWDGEQWSPLPGGPATGLSANSIGIASVNAMTFWRGDLVVAGQFAYAGGERVNGVARWDGATWAPLPGTYGTGTSGSVNALAVYDGDLIVAGSFGRQGRAGGLAVGNIARYDGQEWTPLAASDGAGTSSGVNALAVHDGALYAGGSFTTAGGVSARYIARWDGTDWSPVGSGMSGTVYALAVHDGALHAGGSFTEAGGVAAARVARWDGDAWSPLGGGVDRTAYALAVHDGALFAGGAFRQAGGAAADRVARWDGESWSALAGAGGVGVDDQVRSLASYHGDLYVGGYFRQAGGGVPANGIARWLGNTWAPLASSRDVGIGGRSRARVSALLGFDLDGDGPAPEKLAVGGGFNLAGGYAAWSLALYAPVAPLAHLTVSPRELDFGPVPAGGTAGPATVTLTSTGNLPVDVAALAAPAAPFRTAGGDCPAAPFTLAPAQSCTIEYEFRPGAGGGYEQSLPVDTGGTGSGAPAVGLRGTGLPAPAELAVAPDPLAVEVRSGQVATHPLTIGNEGEAPLQWELDGTPFAPGRLDPAGEPVPVSHSGSTQVRPGHGLACYNQVNGHTRDNQYLRTFPLPEFGIEDDFLVTDVTFGVQRVHPEADLTVNLYTLEGALRYANLDLLATEPVTLDATQAGRLVTVPVRSRVPAGSTLVVELASADLLGTGWFVPGTNDQGETAPSYLASQTCGLPEPTRFADVGSGAPDVHLVMSVTGRDPVDCSAPQWLSASPESGTTTGGGHSELAVTFDTTGLEPGDYQALVCAGSDDPAAPFTAVPVTLTVTPACDRTISGLHRGRLVVSDGVTCLEPGAVVGGAVTVTSGAGLIATGAILRGPLSATGATVVELSRTRLHGPVLISGTTGSVHLADNHVTGSVSLLDNHTAAPAMLAANVVRGWLACYRNEPGPVHDGRLNTATGGKRGQCGSV